MEGEYESYITDETASGNSSKAICNHSNITININNVDDIIRKYRSKSNFRDQYSNTDLDRNVGNHELITSTRQKPNSVKNYVKYIDTNTFPLKNDRILNKENTYRCETKNNYINKFTCNNARLTSNEKVYHDKTTYCRPVLNYYNEQFLYKTMERNARLKSLVKKLVIARQREKETVSWNNFINDLKSRHGINAEINKNSRRNDEAEEDTPKIIDDYFKTRFSCVKSDPCNRLLQDFYRSYDLQSDLNYDWYEENRLRKSKFNTYFPCERNPYCYPTSSQARLLLDNRRKENDSMNQWYDHIDSGNSFKNIAIKFRRNNDNVQNKRNTNYNYDSLNVAKTSAVQTDMNIYPDFIRNYCRDKATYKADDRNHNAVQTNNNKTNLKQISLTNIDKKLETLISSINTFVDEIRYNKANKRKNKSFNINCNISDNNKRIIGIKSDSNVEKYEKSVNKRISTVPENTAIVSDSKQCYLQSTPEVDQILQILDAESTRSILKDNKHKSQACTYIDFEVPTRDNTTEVTKSLSKPDSEDKEAIIEEINLSSDIPLPRMAIAVNTDPLSLLGLLRISTDTFKQFLSYMPNINYYSYLSLLLSPHIRKVESRYVCNICGSDFNRPSLLSDHIRSHNLGKTRDCCVCRHVLDLARKNPGLFKCEYCGQLFARAYCCELHQESCAKRFGKNHDVDSKLMLLR